MLSLSVGNMCISFDAAPSFWQILWFIFVIVTLSEVCLNSSFFIYASFSALILSRHSIRILRTVYVSAS